MSQRNLAISLAVGVVASWATGKIVKEFRLPGYVVPAVGTLVAMAANEAARRIF